MQTRRGHFVTYGVSSMPPTAAIFLDLTHHTETAFAMISCGAFVTVMMGTAVFWVCGKSLMGAIDASLEQQHLKNQQLQVSEKKLADRGIQGSQNDNSKGDPIL